MGLLTLFKPNQKKVLSDDSLPLSLLRQFSQENGYYFFESIPMFHRQRQHIIPAMLFDPMRGIYLFDRVNWKAETLKGATVEPAKSTDTQVRDVAVDATHAFMLGKFNEILHTDGAPIKNFLILDHLTQDEFDTLDDSFAQLLPKERLIFSDDTTETIAARLESALERKTEPFESAAILGALFFHFLILPDNIHATRHLLTAPQRRFLETELSHISRLEGEYGSGKSSLILLRSIYDLLRNPQLKIIIVSPTQAACELLKKQLLEIVEYAIIDIDLTSIRILTPQQLIAQHYQKLYKKESFTFAKLTPKMFSHRFHSADQIFCDDAHLMEPEFIRYLKHLQSKGKLCLAGHVHDESTAEFELREFHRTPEAFFSLCEANTPSLSGSVTILEGNPYMRIMLLLRGTLEDVEKSQLLIVVPHSQFAQKLLDEINSYYGTIASIYQADAGLLSQELDHLLIATLHDLAHLQRPYVIIVKEPEIDPLRWCHAIGRASERLYIVESESDNEKDRQNLTGVEEESLS